MNEIDRTFVEISQIIENARENAYRKVNDELIFMYQKVGKILFLSSRRSMKTFSLNMLLLRLLLMQGSNPA